MSSTYTDKDSCDFRWGCFPDCLRSTSSSFFPTAILPMGDCLGFAQGEPLVLQSSPIVSVFHICGPLTLALMTCAPAYKLILRCVVGFTRHAKESGKSIKEFCCCQLPGCCSLLCNYCSVSTVVFDVLSPGGRVSPCILGDVWHTRSV